MAEPPTTTTGKVSIVIFNTAILTNLRKRCLDINDCIVELAQKTNELLNRDQQANSKNYTQGIIEELVMSQALVKNMELRASVVAPMKAGKSTIINSILGENILPARNAAMTVIPTEVVLIVSSANATHKSEQAKLSLPRELIKQLTTMRDEMRTHLQSSSNKLGDLTKQLLQHPHLASVAKTILDGTSPEFKETTVGNTDIWKLLEFLNDVIRLHENLMPTSNLAEIQRLSQNLPRITAPYRSLGNETVISESLGNLVIIDTPGPNEDTPTNFLQEIFIQELRKATVILVVLDFTALNTQADKTVQTEIRKIRDSNSSSNGALFALVNKCDQRRRGDMTPEEVRSFVRNKFEIGNDTIEEDDNRVFEIQAIRALLAKQFRMELDTIDENKAIRYDDLPSGQDFLTEAYGATYDHTDSPTLQKIKNDTVKLWQKSGFEGFLTNVVEKLIERAAPHILENALAKCFRRIHDLRESLEVRERLLEADVTKLHMQIDAFQDDLTKLTHIMKEEKNAPHKEQQEIIENVTRQFSIVSCETKSQLTTILNKNVKSNEQPTTSESNIGATVWTAAECLLRKNIREALLHAGFALVQLWAKYMNSDPSMEFDTEVEGQEFISNIEREVRNIAEKALVTIRSTVDKECSLACQRLNDRLHKATQDILLKAQNRFSDTFNIELRKPPEFDLRFSELSESTIQMDKTYRPWWLLGLVHIPYNEGYKEGTKYHLNKAIMKMHCTELLSVCMNSIQTELNNYLHEMLQQTFDQHFHEVESRLQKYQNYVKQSVSDQKRTMKEKANFKMELSDLRGRLENPHQTIITIKADLQIQLKHPSGDRL